MKKALKEHVAKHFKELDKATDNMQELWREEILFSWQWWTNVGLTIFPWLFWIKYRKKDSTMRLLCAGFFVLIISSWLDFIGVSFGVWYYVYDVVFTIPSYISWDFTLMPVTVMFLLQTKPSIHPFMKAVIFGALTSFVAEPITVWAGLYVPGSWKHYYSFPIQIAIYLVAHFIATRESWAKISDD